MLCAMYGGQNPMIPLVHVYTTLSFALESAAGASLYWHHDTWPILEVTIRSHIHGLLPRGQRRGRKEA
jgi:hypothetical protein